MNTLLENEIRDFVLTTLNESMNIPVDPAEVSDDSPIGTGGIDLESLGLVELTLRIERQFGVKIPDAEIEPLGSMTLGQLVADIARRRAAA